MGTERARIGTFRAGPRGLSTQSSLKCLFVGLFVCLFIFPHKCIIGDKSLQISKQYPLLEQKLLVIIIHHHYHRFAVVVRREASQLGGNGLDAHGFSTERARLAGGTSLRLWFQKKVPAT